MCDILANAKLYIALFRAFYLIIYPIGFAVVKTGNQWQNLSVLKNLTSKNGI